jgi:putative membrane protein
MTDFLYDLMNFAAYFASGLLATVIFILIYTAITPHKEIELIKNNNQAAAIAFGGSLLGFAIAITSLIENAVDLIDFSLWAMVAILIQILAYLTVRLLFPRIVTRIENNETSAAIWLAACSIGAGLLNAASMSY